MNPATSDFYSYQLPQRGETEGAGFIEGDRGMVVVTLLEPIMLTFLLLYLPGESKCGDPDTPW